MRGPTTTDAMNMPKYSRRNKFPCSARLICNRERITGRPKTVPRIAKTTPKTSMPAHALTNNTRERRMGVTRLSLQRTLILFIYPVVVIRGYSFDIGRNENWRIFAPRRQIIGDLRDDRHGNRDR